MDFLLEKGSRQIISNTLNRRRKERIDIILDPFQSLLQIALLSFCPIGTKFNIENNILQIQMPTYVQGILRWYNNDNRDDLFYLFYVCKRFSSFYGNLRYVKNKNTNLYELMVRLGKNGLTRLIQTYSDTDKISLLHTLEFYKLLLERPNEMSILERNYNEEMEILEEEYRINNVNDDNESIKDEYNKIFDNDMKKEITTDESEEELYSDTLTNSEYSEYSKKREINENKPINIETIFKKINTIYTIDDYNIVFNTLLKIKTNEYNDVEKQKIIYGINNILYPTTSKIHKWINENIVF